MRRTPTETMMNPMTMKSDPGGAVDIGSVTVGPVGPVGFGWVGGTALESTRNGMAFVPWFPALSQAFTVATWAPRVQCPVTLVEVPRGWKDPPSTLTSYRTTPDAPSDPVQERGASGASTSAPLTMAGAVVSTLTVTDRRASTYPSASEAW